MENDKTIEGVPILRCDVVNSNGNMYPREVIEKSIQEAKIPMFGSIGMPDLRENGFASVAISNISHTVDNFSIQDDGYVLCDVHILNTPKGAELQYLLKDGYVFRTTGIGTCVIKDEVTVVKDFQLLSVNVVADGAKYEKEDERG